MPRSNDEAWQKERYSQTSFRFSWPTQMWLLRLLNHSRNTERPSLLPLHEKERAVPRKALFARGSTYRTNQKFSSKSFFVEPRHRKSSGRTTDRREASKRGGQNYCSKSKSEINHH